MEKKELELSVIIPAYKEMENLAILIPEIEEKFKDVTTEIIVVDDNSQDGTEKLIEELNKKFQNVRIITRPALNGVGSALRDGYNAALGTYILSADADLCLPVKDMVRLYQKIKEGFDMAIGYRYGSHGYYEKKSLVIRMKYLISRPGSILLKLITGIHLKDFSNNSRIMRRDKWLTLKTYENGNAFLFEIILKAARKGLTIAEIPISCYERKIGKSKLNLWKEAPKSLYKLFKYALFP
ncbi:MAG: glycosyltransferase [Candidatus Paceibacterota bacterium]|jgi:dolichol-phosphate mannosyltransferase